jgi:hypothetical protein
MATSNTGANPPLADWPLYWFAILEKAVEQGDHVSAARAHRELGRLGVRVAYGRPPANESEARHAD